MNPESEILNGEARDRPGAAPSPGDQDAVSSAANESPPTGANGPDPPPSPQKPKRKYRVSDKVRASSPENLKQARKKFVFTEKRRAAAMKALEKANAAPPEKRNRLTQRRLLARHANLCLAHLKLGPPGQRSPSHIYTGTSCRHLEHSVALAGEDKAKLEAHRDRFQRAFRPRDREERRFVRGMAETAWRLLRVFGGRLRWELRAVQYRLMLGINWRQAGKKLEAEDACVMVRRLLFDLGDLAGLQEERQVLQKRLEQLLRAFLSHRMGAPSSFCFFTKLSSRLPDFEQLPDFALGNPFLKPGQARQAAEQEAAGAKNLKPAKDWAGSGTEDNGKKRGPARRLSEEEKFVRHQMLRALGYDDEMDQAGLERLLEQAFGIDDCRLTIDDCQNPSVVRGPLSVAATDNGPLTTDRTPQSSIDNRQSSIAKTAATLWKRVVLFRNWRDSEASHLGEVLEQASGPQGVETWEPQPPASSARSLWQPEPEDESPHWQWRALAALLLSVFASDLVMLTQAFALGERLKRGFYNFLVGHYRQRRGFNPLRPDPKHEPPSLWQPWEAGALILQRWYANGVEVMVMRE